MPLGRKVGFDPSDIVLDGELALPPQKGGRAPFQFSAYVYCGQMAAWIKMPLGMKVGLGPGHIVLDRYQAVRRQKSGHNPEFSAHVCRGQTVAHLSYC